MTTDAFNIEITEDNCESIADQMTDENKVASLDCLALNPNIADQLSSIRPQQYELTIHKVNVEDQALFLLYFDDALWGDFEDFAVRAFFFKTEAEAMAAMGAEYNDWLTRF